MFEKAASNNDVTEEVRFFFILLRVLRKFCNFTTIFDSSIYSNFFYGCMTLKIVYFREPSTAVFFSYADPSEKFHFSNRYNFCSDELFRIKSKKKSILSGVLLLLAHKYSLRCLVSILDLKIFHLGRHRKKNTTVNSFVLKIWLPAVHKLPQPSILLP